MKIRKKTHRLAIALRWLAPGWSLLVALTVLPIILDFDNQAGGQRVSLVEWALLLLYPVAARGLILAWRWEPFGGWLAIRCMLGEVFGFRLIKGMWYPDWFGFLACRACCIWRHQPCQMDHAHLRQHEDAGCRAGESHPG